MTKQLEALFAVKLAAKKAESNFIPTVEVGTLNVLEVIASLEQSQQEVNRLSRLKTVNAARVELHSEFVHGYQCGEQAAEKRIAELESTLELEREKSRRVMSQNYQLEAQKPIVLSPAMREHIKTGAEDEYSLDFPDAGFMRDADLLLGKIYVAPVASPLAVNLPESFYPDGDIDCPKVMNEYEVIEAIRAAGGQVEGE